MCCMQSMGLQRVGDSLATEQQVFNCGYLDISYVFLCIQGFLGDSDGKESACNTGDMGLIPGSENPLEKGIPATHSSILTWRIPWTEELGGLQPMVSRRVRHNLVTKPPPPSAFFSVITFLQAPVNQKPLSLDTEESSLEA